METFGSSKMVDLVETRQEDLKKKRICRFCLSRDDVNLTNIYSRENRMKTAPLPLQVMACVSIEVFSNDCMPGTVCNECRLMFDYCYRFKQMCKKADTCLRHYPLTGVWAPAMDKPTVPPELIKRSTPVQQKNLNALQVPTKSPPILQKIDIDEESCDTILTMDKDKDQQESEQTEPQVDPESGPEPEIEQKPKPAPKLQTVKSEKPTKKLLNKSAIRILNKEAQQVNEPRMTKPVLQRDNDGNMAIVTQILDPSPMIPPTDPVESAAVIETNVFPCPHCERSFPLRQLLEIHMVNHNRERSFNCDDCEKSFFSKYDLQKHLLVHTGEKPFKCIICNKGFTRSTLLRRHEKTHTDIPKFICVFCEKPFISQEEMEKHTERHRKNRPFTCKICTKSFAFKQGLERHEVVHCRFQPYQCQYCDQSFSTPSKLSRHLTAHAGARPYPCKLCPKSYLLSHHLTRHMRSHKNGTGSYKCNDCDKTFSSRDDLIYHSAVHATQTLVCPLCKDGFDDIETVTEHVKQHAEGEAFACEFCDLIFMTADRLQDHTDTEHVDEMVAYNEDDQANAAAERKKGEKNVKTNESTNQDIDDVIEEFLIEEFSDAGADNGRNDGASSIIVKEETNWQSEGVGSNEYDESQEDGGTSIGDETLDYMNMIDAHDAMEEPPAKVIKVSEKATVRPSTTQTLLRHKVPAKSAQATPLHSNSSSPKENKAPLLKPSPAVRSKTEIGGTASPKTRQPMIQAALQGLPRSLSVKKVAVATKSEQVVSKSTQHPVRAVGSSTLLNKMPTATTPVKKHSPKLSTNPESGSVNKPTRSYSQRSETSPNIKSEVNTSPSISSSDEMKKPPPKSAMIPMVKKPGSVIGDKKIVEMMIGDKKVKVQRITMSKSQAAAMAREGRIEMKQGTMILKKDPFQSFKIAKKSN